MTSTSSNRPGAIIPANIGALRSLTVAMTVMCYLACLAIGALVLTNRAVSSWTSGLSREVTVQVRQTKDADVEAEVAKAQEILQDFPGIAAVTVLDREAGAKLLEPWLGSRNLEDLPIPRLIRVAVDEAAPPDYEALGAALESVKGANLDTHRRWQSELTRMARALSVLAYTVLTLIAVSSVAIVVFGTRAVLQAHRPIVDLLHLVGARDGYIARQIDGRFLKTGLFAGLLGMGLGLVTFFLLSLTGPSGGGGLADASRSLLFAPPESASLSYALLLAVPVMATLISLVTSRVTLMRMLGDVL